MKKTSIPPIAIVACVDTHGGFGKAGKIPWNIPEDLEHFKNITTGGICIMGRKTYVDMLEMVQARNNKSGNTAPITDILPNRTSFVVTSDNTFCSPGATPVTGIRAAIETLDMTDRRPIFVIGGYGMFIDAFTWADTIHLSIVKGEPYNCDKFFPIAVLDRWYDISAGNQTEKLYFVTYRRRKISREK